MGHRSALFVAALALGCASGPEAFTTVPPLGSGGSSAQEIETTLILLGDAGWARSDDPILARVAEHAAERPDRTVVVFLGDNVYPDGLAREGASDRKRGEDVLLAQVAVERRSGARVIFVPGNHDWDNGRDRGFDEILGQEQFLEAHGAELLPGGGCPGPSVVDVEPRVRLVALDTQWWLHEGVKPHDPMSTCPADSPAEVLDGLGAALAGAAGRHVVVVAHHPVVSQGPHAGHFTWKDHIFPLTNLAGWLWLPLPVVGSIYPLARGAGITPQDLTNSVNERMRAALDSVFAIHHPLIYAAGHDHSLQVFRGETARYFLVSGASTVDHHSQAGRSDETLYRRAGTGFMRVDFTTAGEARLAVVAVDADGTAVEEFSAWLQ